MCNQNGVIRTNCLDSLDRTNVVQSVIARNILHKQLYKINIITRKPKVRFLIFIYYSGDPFEKFESDFENHFRNLWTNNADEMSLLYSGSKALKTDFTRTGKFLFQFLFFKNIRHFF